MAPRWPKVNNAPEHINEHATYLKEACNELQAVDRGRQNQVPWSIIQPYLTSTIALVGKVLRQPAMSEILQQIQDAARCTQSIQRDVTIIKTNVGLSNSAINASNFTGLKTGTSTWAQIAARGTTGAAIPLPPPPPQNTPATNNQPTVTAYKDRMVIVKLKDSGIVQRFRIHSSLWGKERVTAAIRSNEGTKFIKVVAAHQLKSGDIQAFMSTAAEVDLLQKEQGWLRGLGENAELVQPTFGVIVHGVATNSMNMKEQESIVEQILADNYTVIPKAEISHIGWLTRESTFKRASSIVVEFKDPAAANAVIYAGMVWNGQIHQCQLYDRTCRLKQCFRCYNYGHIGTQCNATQTCGYCSELHETKSCIRKEAEGFTPKCAVCKGSHNAWNTACPARKQEVERVERAKQNRNT